MGVLRKIGPDTLIPCFSVNISGNEDVNVCNAVNTAIFNDLCHDSAEESEQRMPMIVTSSTMKDHQYSSALEHFKKRLGVRKVKFSQGRNRSKSLELNENMWLLWRGVQQLMPFLNAISVPFAAVFYQKLMLISPHGTVSILP